MRIALLIDGGPGCGQVPAIVAALRRRGWGVQPALLPGASEWLGSALVGALCGTPPAPSGTLPGGDVTLLAPCSAALRAAVSGGGCVPGLGTIRTPVVIVPEEPGPGALLLGEPEGVCEAVAAAVTPRTLAGVPVLVTAGPTCEDLDPVRFLTNRSTGRMGVALALAAWRHGAAVTLVHGPLAVPVPALAGLAAVPVRSAAEMHGAVMGRIAGQRAAILCAAVADFTPAARESRKVSKEGRAEFVLRLVRTPDILAGVGALPERPFLVGFAAETHDLEARAADKLRRKGCDLLCANNVAEPGSGFAVETNRLTLFARDGSVTPLPRLTKDEAAERVVACIAAGLGLTGHRA